MLSQANQTEAAHAASVGVTVHELRRPLTILSSYAQLLDSGALGDLPEHGMTAVHTMCSASDTMMRLVEALAAVTRLEDSSVTPSSRCFSISEVVDAAVAEVIGEAELKGTRVESEVDERLVVNGDRDQLVLALTNLLSNAVKHSPAGDPVYLRAASNNGTVHLAVADHGPGFPASDAERLFDKYFRASSERELGLPGTGLGLYIVRTVAERHGGTARARLLPDGGAEFELTLPAA
jgi:signal transduction histidine kinase